MVSLSNSSCGFIARWLGDTNELHEAESEFSLAASLGVFWLWTKLID